MTPEDIIMQPIKDLETPTVMKNRFIFILVPAQI